MTHPLIELQSVSKSFAQAGKPVTALEDVSMTIDCGDVFGIIGLSGAGKSTLIRSLARLVTPTSGKILFQGIDLFAMGKRDLRKFRKKMGMIFQHFNLLSSRSVAGNIAYAMEVADVPIEAQEKRIDELLDLVGLKEKKHAYPSQLSGGEKQRVGIARALANHPDVLLCDEATSALDPKTTKEILRLLSSINKKLGVTIVLITHEMGVIKQICNKVAVIQKGKIVESGSVVDVFSDPQHPTTRHFLEETAHEIPDEFFKEISPSRKLLRLRFKGKAAGEPLISQLVRKFDVDANILMGWIDRLQSLFLGTLIIELTGKPEGITKALAHLQENKVHYEVIENDRR
ncbi:MAG: ATP-binding cassette domain-containing protein [Verrucomicrobia bacterium]|nr:ATP-binding cassette domain-containing protein [Verrucomicrobiota bacterium]